MGSWQNRNCQLPVYFFIGCFLSIAYCQLFIPPIKAALSNTPLRDEKYLRGGRLADAAA